MVPTQLSNSGEVHFVYEVIHDIHKQVSSSLFRRWRSSKETLSFASLLHQRDSQYPAHKKQLKRRWGHYYFLSLPLPAIFWQLPMQVLMSQMLSKRLEVNVIYCCIANKADLFYIVSLLELIKRTSNLSPNSRSLYLQLQVTRDLDTLQLNGVSPKRKRR